MTTNTRIRRTSLAGIAAALAITVAIPQPAWSAPRPGPIRILVLHWYDRTFKLDGKLDEALQRAMRSAAQEGVEYYAEYLEANKLPEAKQPELLANYLQQKYAGRKIDVVVAEANAALEFLLKYRAELFSDTPIVFAADRMVNASAMSQANATGFIMGKTYTKTLSLALKLHPGTEQVFVVSGTLNHDKSLEAMVRDDLQLLGNRVRVDYLTDVSVEDLTARLRNLSMRSLVLYIWQQVLDRRGVLLESTDVLARIASEANAPVYGRSYVNVGLGIVGGYVWTYDAYIDKITELTMRIARGEHARDIPIEALKDTPMFDWRQLQRWGIREDLLPAGSVIQFRDLTMWQQFKWRIVIAIAVFVLQALLVGALLIARHASSKAQGELVKYKDQLEELVQDRTAELVEARDQAMAASRAKNIFLASMSHELRTPLNAILGYSGMVMRDENLLAQHRKDLGIVGKSGEHLLALIDDVLDMAKIESGGVRVESAPIDLYALVEESVNMLREHAQLKNLDLLVDISPRAPRFVRTDPGKLRQVLTNMIGNAVKYTDVGSVAVRLDARPHDDPGQDVLLLDVEDTGIGIAEEDQERVFDPFVQAGGVRTRKGTGLGLAISRSFVRAMGGTIQLQSAPGRGSRFQVELPAHITQRSRPRSGGRRRASDRPGGRPDGIQDPDRGGSKGKPAPAATAAGGRGFSDRRRGGRPAGGESLSVVAAPFHLDGCCLPHLNGFEAAGQIRELEDGREVKIAVVTASAFGSGREEALAAGFDDFLRKPYRPNAIFDCMARHLKVRYVYGAQAATGEAAGVKRVENLGALPEVMREELKSAVVALDRERIAEIITRIEERDATLGGTLKRLAAAFGYTSIFEALEGCKGLSQAHLNGATLSEIL